MRLAVRARRFSSRCAWCHDALDAACARCGCGAVWHRGCSTSCPSLGCAMATPARARSARAPAVVHLLLGLTLGWLAVALWEVRPPLRLPTSRELEASASLVLALLLIAGWAPAFAASGWLLRRGARRAEDRSVRGLRLVCAPQTLGWALVGARRCMGTSGTIL